MAAPSFKAFISNERKRLTKRRNDVIKRKAALDEELAQIENEFKAIAAYEGAKTRKAAGTRFRARVRSGLRASSGRHRGRAGPGQREMTA